MLRIVFALFLIGSFGIAQEVQAPEWQENQGTQILYAVDSETGDYLDVASVFAVRGKVSLADGTVLPEGQFVLKNDVILSGSLEYLGDRTVDLHLFAKGGEGIISLSPSSTATFLKDGDGVLIDLENRGEAGIKGAAKCQTKCKEGYHACCRLNSPGNPPKCNCYKKEALPPYCDAGGEGAEECELEMPVSQPLSS